MLCFVFSFFVACFWWNFNAMAAALGYMAAADAAATECERKMLLFKTLDFKRRDV